MNSLKVEFYRTIVSNHSTIVPIQFKLLTRNVLEITFEVPPILEGTSIGGDMDRRCWETIFLAYFFGEHHYHRLPSTEHTSNSVIHRSHQFLALL